MKGGAPETTVNTQASEAQEDMKHTVTLSLYPEEHCAHFIQSSCWFYFHNVFHLGIA